MLPTSVYRLGNRPREVKSSKVEQLVTEDLNVGPTDFRLSSINHTVYCFQSKKKSLLQFALQVPCHVIFIIIRGTVVTVTIIISTVLPR